MTDDNVPMGPAEEPQPPQPPTPSEPPSGPPAPQPAPPAPSEPPVVPPPPPPSSPGEPPAPPTPSAQAVYAPPPPPEPSDYAVAGATSPAPHNRRNLVVIIVVVAVLLLCCCALAIGGLYFYGSSVVDETTVDEIFDNDTVSGTPDEARLETWSSIGYEYDTITAETPDDRQTAIADEMIGSIYPDLVVDEVAIDPGGYDADEDSYYTDAYSVHAHLSAAPEVKIATNFTAVAREGADAGLLTINPASLGDGWTIGTLANGQEYDYPDSLPLLQGGASESTIALLRTVSDEWPGCAITWCSEEDDGTTINVNITTWRHYATTDDFQGIKTYYAFDGIDWSLVDWTVVE